MRSWRFSLFVIAATALVAGCTAFDRQPIADADEAGEKTAKAEVGSEWDFVGKEGRGNRPLQQDPDPWWRHLQDPRSTSVERNLGIVY